MTRALLSPTTVHRRCELTPKWPLRLSLGGVADGVARRRGGVLERLLHVDHQPVLVRCAQPQHTRVVIGAWAESASAAEQAITAVRRAIGVDDDLEPFYRRFRSDPLIGRSLLCRPWLRATRRPVPFEALAWAICEQLIEYVRAAAIERRIVARLGRHCPHSGLRDLPSATQLAGASPALLESFDLAQRRALTLIGVAREVASGRIDLDAADQDVMLRRLRAQPGIGSWTIAIVALGGLGRYDIAPAGDVHMLKRAGQLLSGGDPEAVASEAQALDLLARYEEWQGLAALHLMGSAELARPDDRPRRYGARLAAPAG